MTDLAAVVTRISRLSPDQRTLLERQLRAAAAEPVPQRSAHLDEPFPLTPAQRRVWDTQIQVADTPVDIVCQAMRIDGPIDAQRLRQALIDTCRVHEALRTTFTSADGEVTQRVRESVDPDVRLHADADVLSDAEAHRLAAELAWEPFDLEHGPLLRAVVAGRDEQHWLLLAVHNLVFDAWSFEVLLDGIAEAYESGTAPSHAADALRPADFEDWQRRWTASHAGRRAEAYWSELLADPAPPLRTDQPRTQERTGRGRRHAFALPENVAPSLTAFARTQSATPFQAWCTVLGDVLAELSGGPDVVFGTFQANRTAAGTDRLVGYLLNVLPVRWRVAGDATPAERLRACRTALLEAQRHAAYPIELLAAGKGRGVAGAHPMFDVVFVFENLSRPSRALGAAQVVPSDVDKGTARYDLTVAVYDEPGGAHAWIEYDTALFEQDTIQRFADRFVALATAVATPGGGR